MHGKGSIIWKDGKSYQGYYVEDKKHGKGVIELADGQKYLGYRK